MCTSNQEILHISPFLVSLVNYIIITQNYGVRFVSTNFVNDWVELLDEIFHFGIAIVVKRGSTYVPNCDKLSQLITFDLNKQAFPNI